MSRMLIDSGRLEPNPELMQLRLRTERDENEKQVWWAAGDYRDSSRDRNSFVDSIVENFDTRERTVSRCIQEQGWSNLPFAKKYFQTYRKAVEDALADDIDSIYQWAHWEG